MIYYCIHKNECSFKDCTHRQRKSKFSDIGAKKDLTINEFTCGLTGKKRARLISDERVICNRYKECGINCFLKTSYITANNFEHHLGNRFDLSKPFKCHDAKRIVHLRLGGENVGNYISIWD
jgi:hypothetical protein